MRRVLFSFAAMCLIGVSMLTGSPDTGRSTSITGWVLDSACAFTKNLEKPISRECAVACAKAGSPLVILGSDGTIYWPISESMPATGQNERLMPFAGKHVSITGKVFARGGSHAIIIEKIAEEGRGK